MAASFVAFLLYLTQPEGSGENPSPDDASAASAGKTGVNGAEEEEEANWEEASRRVREQQARALLAAPDPLTAALAIPVRQLAAVDSKRMAAVPVTAQPLLGLSSKEVVKKGIGSRTRPRQDIMQLAVATGVGGTGGGGKGGVDGGLVGGGKGGVEVGGRRGGGDGRSASGPLAASTRAAAGAVAAAAGGNIQDETLIPVAIIPSQSLSCADTLPPAPVPLSTAVSAAPASATAGGDGEGGRGALGGHTRTGGSLGYLSPLNKGAAVTTNSGAAGDLINGPDLASGGTPDRGAEKGRRPEGIQRSVSDTAAISAGSTAGGAAFSAARTGGGAGGGTRGEGGGGGIGGVGVKVEVAAERAVSPVAPQPMIYEVKVDLLAAKNLPAANISGTADPYAIVSCGTERRFSSVIPSSRNPMWAEEFRFFAPCLPALVSVRTYDWDIISKNAELGAASLLVEGEALPFTAWYPLDKGMGQVCLQLQVTAVPRNKADSTAAKGAAISSSRLRRLSQQPTSACAGDKQEGEAFEGERPEQQQQEQEAGRGTEVRLKPGPLQTIFGLPPDEVIRHSFSCALERSFLYHGRMFLSGAHLCFHSNVFSKELTVCIPYQDIEEVRRSTHALINPAMTVVLHLGTGGHGVPPLPSPDGRVKYKFASFWNRGHAMRLLQEAIAEFWKTEEAAALEEEQDRLRAISMRDGALEGLSFRGAALEAAEEEKEKQPFLDLTVLEHLLQFEVPCTAETYFNLLYSDSSDFVVVYRAKRKDTELKVGEWKETEQYGGKMREVTYRSLCDSPMCPPSTAMTEWQHTAFSAPDHKHLVLELINQAHDVPFGSYFEVHAQWTVKTTSDNPESPSCSAELKAGVHFKKWCMMQGKIRQGAQAEMKRNSQAMMEMAMTYIAERTQGGNQPADCNAAGSVGADSSDSNGRGNGGDVKVEEGGEAGGVEGRENLVPGGDSRRQGSVDTKPGRYVAHCWRKNSSACPFTALLFIPYVFYPTPFPHSPTPDGMPHAAREGTAGPTVCRTLLEKGQLGLSLQDLTRFTALPPPSLRSALLVLVQHNCAQAFRPQTEDTGPLARTPTLYISLQDSILPRLRFPKFMAQTNELLGDEHYVQAEAVVEALLGDHSHLSRPQLVKQPKFPQCVILPFLPAPPLPLPTHLPSGKGKVVEALLEHGRLFLHQLAEAVVEALLEHGRLFPCRISPPPPLSTFPLPHPAHTSPGRGSGGGSFGARPPGTAIKAEAVVEALLEHGRLSLHQLVQRSVAKAGSSDPSAAKTEGQIRQQLVAALSVLIHERLVERVGAPEPMLPARGASSGGDAPKPAARARVVSLFSLSRHSFPLISHSGNDGVVGRMRATMESSGYFDSEEHRVVVAARCSHSHSAHSCHVSLLALSAHACHDGIRTRAMMESSGYFDSEEHRVVIAARCSDALRFQLPAAWVLSGGDGAGGNAVSAAAVDGSAGADGGMSAAAAAKLKLPAAWVLSGGGGAGGGAASAAAVDGSTGTDGGMSAAAAAKLKVIIRIVVIVLALVLLVVLWMGAQGRMVEYNEDEDEEQAGPSAKRPATGLAAGGGKCRWRGEASFSRQCYAAFSRGLGKRVVLDADDAEEEQAGPSAKRQALAALHHTVFPISALAPHPTAPPLQRKRVVLDDDDEEEQAGPSAKRPALRKRVVLDDDDEEEQAGPSAKRLATGAAPHNRKRVVLDDDDDEEQAGPSAKRPATGAAAGGGEKQGGGGEDSGVLWRVNYEEFLRRTRHQTIVDFVRESIDPGASIITAALLHAGKNQETSLRHPYSASLSLDSIVNAVRGTEDGRTMALDRIRAALQLLVAHPSAVASRSSDAHYTIPELAISLADAQQLLYRMTLFFPSLHLSPPHSISPAAALPYDAGRVSAAAGMAWMSAADHAPQRTLYLSHIHIATVLPRVHSSPHQQRFCPACILHPTSSGSALRAFFTPPAAVLPRVHSSPQQQRFCLACILHPTSSGSAPRAFFTPPAAVLPCVHSSPHQQRFCLACILHPISSGSALRAFFTPPAAVLPCVHSSPHQQRFWHIHIATVLPLAVLPLAVLVPLEVPKTADHAPQRTFYLWRIHIGTVLPRVLNHMCHGACNLRLRLEHEMQQEQEVLSLLEQIEQAHAAHSTGGAASSAGGGGGAPEKAVALTSGQRKQLERIRRVRSGVPFSGGGAAGERRAEEAAGEYSGVAVVLL
ncbi:unnamed protein product [Closterium sp. NIES-64]|nr:unnamed protein product [Closterium sp. NIES-64]